MLAARLEAFLIEHEQPPEDFLFGRLALGGVGVLRLRAVGEAFLPAVGGGDGTVEVAVGQCQPGRPAL